MYHYVYKVIHIETNQFYIGSRSSKVHPTLDSYLGSMSVWKPDKTKLKKEIIKDDFICREDAIKFEAEEITKFIDDPLNENYYIPAIGYHVQGTATVKDANGITCQVLLNDPKYIAGEFVGATKYTYLAIDSNDKIIRVAKNDSRITTGEIRFVSITKGYCNAIDINGNKHWVKIDDERFKSGELVGVWKNKKHTEESKAKMRLCKGKQSAEKNSQFGTTWIHNIELKQNKKIKKTDAIPFGWIAGRKIKF
ncbi:MAG: hypothetical protein M0R51_01855 [Clostridia bacterium]|jgi:hypothetical protein|nr:hypothetical protein [Clostridia bacterium]